LLHYYFVLLSIHIPVQCSGDVASFQSILGFLVICVVTVVSSLRTLCLVFCCLIQYHSAYIEVAELLVNKDPLGAVDVYSRLPTAPVPTFDDAYIFGEIVRILYKLEAYDDPRMLKNMIAMGKVMGLGIITLFLQYHSILLIGRTRSCCYLSIIRGSFRDLLV